MAVMLSRTLSHLAELRQTADGIVAFATSTEKSAAVLGKVALATHAAASKHAVASVSACCETSPEA